MTVIEESFSRRIRSFIRRQGRITHGQQHALENYWERYCLETDRNYDFKEIFGRKAPLIVEIGFGNGESLVQMAAHNPGNDYVGIEVHHPGIGHLMMKLAEQELTNVRIFCHDAVEILEQRFADNSLAGVQLFFPDPWPKKKHHKRRIVKPSFVKLLIRKLQQGGYFHAATDWQSYAESMLSVLSAEDAIINTSQTNDYCKRPSSRPLTKFEQRGIRIGHSVWDLIFQKR